VVSAPVPNFWEMSVRMKTRRKKSKASRVQPRKLATTNEPAGRT
jgi:hypothetical protein